MSREVHDSLELELGERVLRYMMVEALEAYIRRHYPPVVTIDVKGDIL